VTHARRAWVVIGVLLAVAALGACGDEDDEPAAPRTATTPSGAIELSIRYDDGAGRRQTATLSCGGAAGPRVGGFLDGKATASELCAQARSLRALLTAPPDQGRMCTQIYGGPQTARVTGTIDGAKVDRRFTRTNGCEIADFQRAAALLQP
jgi:hypothetical protein